MKDDLLNNSFFTLKNCDKNSPELYNNFLKTLLFFSKEVKEINNSILKNIELHGFDYIKTLTKDVEALSYLLKYNIFISEGLEDILSRSVSPELMNKLSGIKISKSLINLN